MALTLHLIETVSMLMPDFEILGLAAATFFSLRDMASALGLLEIRGTTSALIPFVPGYVIAVALNIEGVIDTAAFRFYLPCLAWGRTCERVAPGSSRAERETGNRVRQWKR